MNQPTLQPYGKDTFILTKDYQIYGVKVPKGYVTDGASIPRIFWIFFPPNKPQYLAASVVHDYLTDIALDNKDYDKFVKADKIFRCMMLQSGCNKTVAFIFYNSCKIYHYFKYRYLRKY